MKTVEFLKANNVDIDKSLELFGDIATYNETLIEFQKGIEGKLARIDKFYKEGDMANYAILVHSLKSDCKYFGFTKLAEIAYQHELESKASNLNFVTQNYESLVTEAKKIIKLVNSYLNDDEATDNTSSNVETSSNENIILVADDSEVIRIFVRKIFNDTYRLAFAEIGDEALNVIREHQNDNSIKAILLDLNMPGTDGFAVLDYLKQNNLFNKMPVTIISGDSSSEAINKAFTYGIVDMLNKPFSEAKIKDAVEKTINQASSL